MHIQALGLDMNLCADGDAKLSGLVEHLRTCEACQRELARLIEGFPLARMLGAGTLLTSFTSPPAAGKG